MQIIILIFIGSDDCAFVNYHEQLKKWIKPGIEADKEVFLATIERVREKLDCLIF
ncbi:MAG TPA: hypothetical protein VF350_06030 [Candidatus Bathyarchaeia archaeon]